MELFERLLKGDLRAAGRLMSRAEAGSDEVRPALGQIYKAAGKAHIIGLTGVPGSGKSTLVSKLVETIREDGRKVGVIAIDPSSPFSGGAILGDRIRMTNLAMDHGVYIRSMATRGSTGGLAFAILRSRIRVGVGFVPGRGPGELRPALGDADHGRAQHPVGNDVTGLDDLHHGGVGNVRVGHFEHGLMEIRIETLALRIETFDAMLFCPFDERLDRVRGTRHCQVRRVVDVRRFDAGEAVVPAGLVVPVKGRRRRARG